MAIEESTTNRKYETEYAAAKAQGYTGTYADFVRTQVKAATQKAPADTTAAPTTSDTDVIAETARVQSFEELLEVVLLKPEQRTKAFSAEVDELLKASPTLKALAEKLNYRLNPPPEPKAQRQAEPREESPMERDGRERAERRAMMNKRFSRHAVVNGVTLCFMRGYAPNFSTLPSGYVLAVHRVLGTVHPFYFKLYNEAQLRPLPPQETDPTRFRSGSSNGNPNFAGGGGYGQSRRQRQQESRFGEGPHELRGLENYGVSQVFLQQRVSMLAQELFNDDVFFCQEVVVAKTYNPCDDRVRFMETSNYNAAVGPETFAVNEVVNFTLVDARGGMNSGWENTVRVCFPGEAEDTVRLFNLTIDTPFPEKFDADDCSAHWVAREIAKRLAYTFPQHVGQGVVYLELGGSFTKAEPRAAAVVL